MNATDDMLALKFSPILDLVFAKYFDFNLSHRLL